MAISGAFYDANVLYPSGLRNFLMHLALTGIFRAHWSADVHEEWMPNLLKHRPDLTRDKLGRNRNLMDKALPTALVTEHEHLIDTIELPDRDDRHVLAAAIHCGARVIVTLNLGDFPSHVLGKYGVEAQHPDDFVFAVLEAVPDAVMDAARNHRSSLRNPPKTPDEHFANLAAQGLSKTAGALRDFTANASGHIYCHERLLMTRQAQVRKDHFDQWTILRCSELLTRIDRSLKTIEPELQQGDAT